MKELNTDHFNTDKIYVKECFLHCELDDYNDNSEKISIFLKKSKEIAKKKNFENLKIVPSYDPGDYDNLSSVGIDAVGYRLETDKEYKRRIESHINRCKINYDQFVQKSTVNYLKEIEKWEEVLNKV